MFKLLALKIISFYSRFISPFLGKHCRFYPSCSQYTYQSIEKYGILKGLAQGAKRVFRCHPFSPGGVDFP